MRRLFLLILALLLPAGPALGYDVLVVQSSRSAAYEEAVRGFRATCSAESRMVALTDYAEADITRLVREDRPRLVVAVGDEAYAAVKKLRQIPVLALMTLGLGGDTRSNATGVSLFASPEAYLPLFRSLKRERIGVVYDPAKTGWYVRRMMAVAREAGLTIVPREARSAREAVAGLGELGGKVDALWLVPDTTTVGKETLSAYFDFSLRMRVPVISFTAVHLRQGAAAAVEIDRTALGRQGGEMATKLLNGTPELPVAPPRATSTKVNGSVMRNLGLEVRDTVSLVLP